MRSLRMGVCLAIGMTATATVLAIGTIKELTLDEGRDDVNRVTAPVAADGAFSAFGTVTQASVRTSYALRGTLTENPSGTVIALAASTPDKPAWTTGSIGGISVMSAAVSSRQIAA